MPTADPGARSCDAVRAELDAFLDGELAGDGAAAIDAHLAACPACAGEAALGRAYRSAMARVGRSDRAPEGLADRVRGIIRGTH